MMMNIVGKAVLLVLPTNIKLGYIGFGQINKSGYTEALSPTSGLYYKHILTIVSDNRK